MKSNDYATLYRRRVPDAELTEFFQQYAYTNLTGYELVISSVGYNAPGGGTRLPNRDYPNQFKFEGTGVSKLVVDSTMPALPAS